MATKIVSEIDSYSSSFHFKIGFFSILIFFLITSFYQFSDNSNKEILFPNPCKDFIQIQTQNEFHKIDIYDIWGKLIISEYPNSNNYTLDISNISNGIYFLSINNKKEQHRIIKH